MILGFSSGCLYKTHKRIAGDTFDALKSTGANALEIICEGVESISELSDIDPRRLEGFEYVSLHAPNLGGFTNEELEKYLEEIEEAQQKFNFNCVVLHPDGIENWEIFSRFNIPWAIENMDQRKDFGGSVEDLREVFEQIDAKMVIDLNHCYVNDNSMGLASDFTEAFGDRITEIHLSGFEWLHEPLFRTRQSEILEAIHDKSLPIIIESGCETVGDAKKEFEYIKSYLGKL